VKRIPHKPYPELFPVLERFTVGVQNALMKNFVGAYLVGSLATGDFDLDSDIDFLIVTDAELIEAEIRSLQALHIEIHDLECYPAKHLEGSYISRSLLSRTDLVGMQPLWYVDNGSTLLERSVHDNRWHVRWILRECAITLAGPNPGTLLPPVSMDALHSEMLASIEKLRTQFLAEIDKPPAYFNTRFGQSFAVLTCCRALHTLHSGAVQSKLSSVQWAERSLAPEWHELIHQAWAERQGVRSGMKVRQPADEKLLLETLRFLAYAQNGLGLEGKTTG
jgi:Aminoglycoside adenylyltransferase, C-terminal domain/Nucleotidyltransferase domain